MAGKAPKIRNALICDDVRQEVNGKHFLIGVYSGDILVPEFPAALALSAYLEIDAPTVGEQELHIRFCGPDGPLSGIRGAIEVQDTRHALALPTPRLPVALDRECEIAVEVSFDDKRWTTAVRKQVRLGVTG